MARRRGLRDSQSLVDLAHADLSLRQQCQDAQARAVRQGPEEGLERVQMGRVRGDWRRDGCRCGHILNIRIDKYITTRILSPYVLANIAEPRNKNRRTRREPVNP